MGVPPFCSFIETEPDSTTSAPMILLPCPAVMLRPQAKLPGDPCTGRASRSAVATRSAPPNRGIVCESLCTPFLWSSQSLSVGNPFVFFGNPVLVVNYGTRLYSCLCSVQTNVFVLSTNKTSVQTNVTKQETRVDVPLGAVALLCRNLTYTQARTVKFALPAAYSGYG
jgi:hypothetical protein